MTIHGLRLFARSCSLGPRMPGGARKTGPGLFENQRPHFRAISDGVLCVCVCARSNIESVGVGVSSRCAETASSIHGSEEAYG